MKTFIAAALLTYSMNACHAESIIDYMPQLSTFPYGAWTTIESEKPRTPFSQYIGDGNMHATWIAHDGTIQSIESWRVNEGYLWLDGFGVELQTPPQYPVTCIKATIERLDTGAVAEIPCEGQLGTPYAPMTVPSYAYRMRTWGVLVGNLFYGEATFYQPKETTNKCWFTGAEKRLAITQTQVWWDAVGGWQLGTGHGRPFNAKGAPVVPAETEELDTQTIGLGYGMVWTFAYANMCGFSAYGGVL